MTRSTPHSSALERNPQAGPMAHESMVRNLAAQAQAIWPLERPFLERYHLPRDARILDLACGTGEIVTRLAREFPQASITGIDLHEPHLALARERCREFGARVELRRGDAFALDLPAQSFDLVLCRHLLQAVPAPRGVLAEMKRVTRRGGWLHLVAEDYGMIHCAPCAIDDDRFWREGPVTFGRNTGTDLYCGRNAHHWLVELGLEEVRVDYAIVDTVRVRRELLVEVLGAWRDGYSDIIAAHSALAPAEVRRSFDAILTTFADPRGYGVWMLPIVGGRVA